MLSADRQDTSRFLPSRRLRLLAFAGLVVMGLALGATASDVERNEQTVIVVPVEGIVDLGMAPHIERVVKEAAAENARAILLDINTLGGRVDAALLIRDALVASKVETIAFIDPRAISAGAFISFACQKIVMSPGGSIGAATPVVDAGGEMTAADEKMVSYWRSEMRTTAERNGRRGDIAEAMVDREVEIEGVIEKGKLLTLTTTDALRLGVADFAAETREEVAAKLGLGEVAFVERQANWAERVARIVSHPALSSLLMSLGFLGILIELYQPGWGIPGTVGVICLLLFFFGHYVVNLAGIEELLLFALGLLLLGLEIFVIPGFGVVGVAGVACMVASVFLALIGLDFKLSWELGFAQEALQVMAASAIVTLVGVGLALRFLPGSRAGHFLVQKRELSADAGYRSHETEQQERHPKGTRAQAIGDLRPSGMIRIGRDRIDAVSEGMMIRRGATVEIVAWREGHAVVRQVAAEPATPAESEVAAGTEPEAEPMTDQEEAS